MMGHDPFDQAPDGQADRQSAALDAAAPPRRGLSFAEVVEQRLTRRGLLRVSLVLSTAALAGPALDHLAGRSAAAQIINPPTVPGVEGPLSQNPGRPASTVNFPAIANQPTTSDVIVLPPGYRHQVLLRWGDPLFPGVPAFDLNTQTAALQERRVGFNHDYTAFLPLPQGSRNPNEGIVWINHEYTEGPRMFPVYSAQNPTLEQVNIELAAHGAALAQVRRGADGNWSVTLDSPFNRRITATTPIRISGPAAGDALLRTTADPTGTVVLGMLNNCAGGLTPWGTVLTCEENFNQYFGNVNGLPNSDRRKAIHQRYGVTGGASERLWERFYARYDVVREPNEPFRFGWCVEVDPYDAGFQPVKRTALGRTKHEAATCVIARNNRVAVYTGDDERFDYAYKFVTQGTYNATDRAANFGLLDSGTLYVARFNADGSGDWLPVVFGQGPLTAANGFPSQAEVLIRTRQAGDALGATKMDRPEDIETNPKTGKVYLVLTNNTNRGVGTNPGVDPANPRANNRSGHIIEITETDNDHTATTFRWEIFLLCGDPADPSTFFAGFPKDQVSKIGSPDNIAFDRRGNMWIGSDGQPGTLSINDGYYACPTEGPDRGHVRQFMSVVAGAEATGPTFTPRDLTFIAAVQHPGENGTLANPQSRWPNAPTGPAQAALVFVQRDDGRAIPG